MKTRMLFHVAMMLLLAVVIESPVLASELLDVKPVVTGSGVVIEVTADIPMTYTYYKVPGQARAVVDIADADPEKVEPLIVVNKGGVGSISVDKAMIGDMTVSRLVFNLVSEAEISVNHLADRKTLNVSFNGGKPAAVQPITAPAAPVAVPEPAPVSAAAPVSSPAVPVPAALAAPAAPASKEEEDPLGLDEAPTAAAPAKETPAAAPSTKKLEPVVPEAVVQALPSGVVLKGVVIGASYIDIQTNSPVESFKKLKLSKPERLVIEFPGTNSMKLASIQVKRFGIAKVRVGATPGMVRVVFDAAKPVFPAYEVVARENGVRVSFR
jgi:type IV pilus assembly protein PilQ